MGCLTCGFALEVLPNEGQLDQEQDPLSDECARPPTRFPPVAPLTIACPFGFCYLLSDSIGYSLPSATEDRLLAVVQTVR